MTTSYQISFSSNQVDSRTVAPEDPDFDEVNYTYDLEGKLERRQNSNNTNYDKFLYGFGRRLTKIEQYRNSILDQTITYAYDGLGRRVKMTDSSGTRQFLYDGGMPLLELDANKDITSSYVYGANGLISQRRRNGVAHWHFDEGIGTTAHDVDRTNNGMLTNGVLWSDDDPVFGGDPNDRSLLFDGYNDYVEVPNANTLDINGNEMTITFWMRPTDDGLGYIVRRYNSTGGYRVFRRSNKKIGFQFLGSGWVVDVSLDSQTPIQKNLWTLVAVRYDGSQMQIFINTNLDASIPYTGNVIDAATKLFIGRRNATAGDGSFYKGYLSHVSIYDRVLSDTEIVFLYNRFEGRYEYHHPNALGSPALLTNRSRTLVVYDYDAFGAVRKESLPYGPPFTSNGRFFTGKEWDADVNLYYYSARYYDPYLGRFTSRDPITDGINWYTYVENNPLKYIDPTGEAFVLAIGGAVLGYKALVALGVGGALIGGIGVGNAYNLIEEPFRRAIGARPRWPEGFVPPRVGTTNSERLEPPHVDIGQESFEPYVGSPSDYYRTSVPVDVGGDIVPGEASVGNPTRHQDPRITITTPDGRIYDITPRRVKGTRLEERNPGKGIADILFDNPQPGSKGKKRDPTQAEKDLLDRLTGGG